MNGGGNQKASKQASNIIETTTSIDRVWYRIIIKTDLQYKHNTYIHARFNQFGIIFGKVPNRGFVVEISLVTKVTLFHWNYYL